MIAELFEFKTQNVQIHLNYILITLSKMIFL